MGMPIGCIPTDGKYQYHPKKNRNVQNVVLDVGFCSVLTPIYVLNPRRECKGANLLMTVQSNAVDSNANALMADAFQIQLFQLFLRSRKNHASIQERAACSLNNAAVLTNAKH